MVRLRKKKRPKKLKTKETIFIFIVVIVCGSFIVAGFLHVLNPPSVDPHPPSSYPLAAIIDPLSVTQPNQTFIDDAKTLLEDAGFTVDVYGCDSVTVDFYKNLPTINYSLIIFRTHSGILMNASGQPIPGDPVFLFTAEEYDPSKHNWLLLNDLIAPANPWDTETFYFAISPRFVRETMHGQFYNAVVILDGCHTLYSNTSAEAFLSRGVSVVIGWDDKVIAPHMDAAAIQLLYKLLVEDMTIEQAVEETKNEVGPDPTGGELNFYPSDHGSSLLLDLITF